MSWRARAGLRPWAWRALWALIVAAGVAVKAIQPAQYIFAAGYDDELMVRMALGFLQGHWSTSWAVTGWTTLSKGVGFPIFLAAVHYLWWSPNVSCYLLYGAGVLLTAWSWRRMSGSYPQATIVLVMGMANPFFFAPSDQRVYRDELLMALGAVVVGLAFLAAAELDRRRLDETGGHRLGRSALLLLVSLAIGVTVGAVAVTKPSWYWAIPAALAPVCWAAGSRLRRSRRRLRTAGLTAACLIVAVAACGGAIETVKEINHHVYKVGVIEDLNEGAIARTWKLWASVEAGPITRFRPITHDMRLAVYKVSPTARLIEPYLYSRKDPFVYYNCAGKDAHCDSTGKYLEWALQWSAVQTGEVKSLAGMQRFYTAIADQISAACADGRLNCSSSPVIATGLPRLDEMSDEKILSGTVAGIWMMLRTTSLGSKAPSAVSRPPLWLYDEWTSVVPDMPPRYLAVDPAGPKHLYRLVGIDEAVYGAVSIAGLAVIVLGGLLLLTRRSRRQAWRKDGSRHQALVASILFLCSAVIGMGGLVLLNVGQSPTYVGPLYASDFSFPCELFVMFGAFAAWPVMKGSRRRGPTRESD